MTSKDFLDLQYHLSVMAGMNQRYHHDRERLWTYWDRGFKLVVGLLAAAGAFIAGVTVALPGTRWDIVSLVAAIIAAVAGILLNVFPFADWASRHTALFQRWTDFREDVDDLLHDFDGDFGPELADRLRELDAKKHRICGSEPPGNDRLIRDFYNAEVRSRTKDMSACAV